MTGVSKLLFAALLLTGCTDSPDQPVAGRIMVNGMQMYYEVSGAGDPLVVLHGAYMNIPSMGAIIPKLAETHKVYALELQGHGRTTDIDRPITYPNLADDVAAFMDSVGLRKADVFGYSMGAEVGLQLAIRHPAKVNKLVAASVAYDLKGWQPAFTEMIPQMTCGDAQRDAIREGISQAGGKSEWLPGACEETDRARERADGVGGQREGVEDSGTRHRRRRRRDDARAFCRDVSAARRRRDGRHGEAARGISPRDTPGDVTHGCDHAGRSASWIHRAVSEGANAEGILRAIGRKVRPI